MNDLNIHSTSHCHINSGQISQFKEKTEPVRIENTLSEYALVGYPKKKELLAPPPLPRNGKPNTIEKLFEKNYKRYDEIHEMTNSLSLELKNISEIYKYSPSQRLARDVVREASTILGQGYTVGFRGRSLKPRKKRNLF